MSDPESSLEISSGAEREEAKSESGEEKNDLVEMGTASKETQGGWSGQFYDGGFGYFG